MSYPQPENARSLRSVASAAKRCRACDLWRLGTQTVFGNGPRSAKAVFVGEQPGDQEDKAGEPFVGPAGRLLDEALETTAKTNCPVCVNGRGMYLNMVAHNKRHHGGKTPEVK